MELLLKCGAQPDLGDGDGSTPLSRAVMKRDETVVELLLKYGARPDLKDGFESTPLSKAVELESAAIIQILLAKGAKLNYIYNIVSEPNQMSWIHTRLMANTIILCNSRM